MCIDINPDAINEANEGFLLVLSIDRRQSNTDVIINDGGVAVGVIMDDDRKKYTKKAERMVVTCTHCFLLRVSCHV